MPDDNIFNRITRNYYELTSSEKKLASYIMANGQLAQKMSISEMSGQCNVAQATISRFSRKMGYDGYSDFRLAIAAAIATKTAFNAPLSGEIEEDDTVEIMGEKIAADEIAAINETKALLKAERIRRAADILQRADKVLCMGQGASMLMAEEAAHVFATVFPGYFTVSDSHRQIISACNLTARDAILYFSYSGSTKDLQDVLRIAKKNKVKTILVTRFPGSPGAANADMILQCGFTESPLQVGSITARVAQLYLIDVLFSELCRRDMDYCKARREVMSEALSDKHTT